MMAVVMVGEREGAKAREREKWEAGRTMRRMLQNFLRRCIVLFVCRLLRHRYLSLTRALNLTLALALARVSSHSHPHSLARLLLPTLALSRAQVARDSPAPAAARGRRPSPPRATRNQPRATRTFSSISSSLKISSTFSNSRPTAKWGFCFTSF